MGAIMPKFPGTMAGEFQIEMEGTLSIHRRIKMAECRDRAFWSYLHPPEEPQANALIATAHRGSVHRRHWGFLLLDMARLTLGGRFRCWSLLLAEPLGRSGSHLR